MDLYEIPTHDKLCQLKGPSLESLLRFYQRVQHASIPRHLPITWDLRLPIDIGDVFLTDFYHRESTFLSSRCHTGDEELKFSASGCQIIVFFQVISFTFQP